MLSISAGISWNILSVYGNKLCSLLLIFGFSSSGFSIASIMLKYTCCCCLAVGSFCDLREKARLLLIVLKNIFLITHFLICDSLLSWTCLPTYLCQRQHQSNQNINSPRDWCRISFKFGKKHVIHQFNQNFMSTTKVNFDSTNFVISHNLEREECILLWLDRMHQEVGLWLL